MNDMSRKKHDLILEKIVPIFLFMFIFTSVNRVFTPFKVEPRIFVLGLGIVILVINLLHSEVKICLRNRKLFILLVYSIFSTLLLFRQFHEFNLKILINLNILIFYNIVALLVLNSNYAIISRKRIYKSFSISIFVLFFSMTCIRITGRMDFIYGLNSPGWVPQENFLMQHFRIAGFAEDANHASFWILTYAVIHYKSVKDKRVFIITAPIFIYFYMLSASKTILVTFGLGVVIIFFREACIKKDKTVYFNIFRLSLIFGVVSLLIVSIEYDYNILPFSNLDTMRTRYQMWTNATHLWHRSPIFGNGLSAFRNYFEQEGNWFVQAHSTIFQLLSEQGLIGLGLYLSYINSLFKRKGRSSLIFSTIIFMMSITNELVYLPFLVVYDLLINKYDEGISFYQETAHVYLVNSLQGGGAEKAVVTLANESNSANITYVLTIKESCNYNNFRTIFVGSKVSNPIINMFISYIKLESRLLDINYKYNIELLSTHLPRMQMLMKFSFFRDCNLNILHGSTGLLSSNKFIKKSLSKLMFNNTNVASVSSGIVNELNSMGITPRKIFKINNPIDFKKIDLLSSDCSHYQSDKDFILYVGRLDKNKDPFLAIKIYEEFLKIRDDLQLVFLGDGPLRVELENYIKTSHLSEKVVIKGYLSNPYCYIKEAEIVMFTSTSEAYPITMIESLYLQTPIITTKSTRELKNILSEENKEFIMKKNTEVTFKMATAIERYLEDRNFTFDYNFEKNYPSNVLLEYIGTYKEI